MGILEYLCDHVYIRLGPSYTINRTVCDLEMLLDEIARCNSDDGEQLYAIEDGEAHYFKRKTKALIVKKTCEFIVGMQETSNAPVNMACFVSLKQFNRLMYSLKEEKRCVSCYSLIYIYIMYTLLEGKSKIAKDCLSLAQYTSELSKAYYLQNPDDPLAAFICGCGETVIEAITVGNTKLSVDDFPRRPRKHARDQE